MLCLCLAVTVQANDQSLNRNKRQMFSSSGLVFPGPPRRRSPQQVQPSQSRSGSADSSGNPSEQPTAGPLNRQPQLRTNAEPSIVNPPQPIRPPFQERSSIERVVPTPVSSLMKAKEAEQDKAFNALPLAQAYRARQPVKVESEEGPSSSSPSSEEYDYSSWPSQREEKPERKYPQYADERPSQYQPRRPANPQPPTRKLNYPEGYRPAQPQKVRGNNIEAERPSRRPVVKETDAYADYESTEEVEEEEEEEHKPDKLQLKLQESDFSCATRKNGYYADEGLDCEIFHYCADGVMHSWLCPEGASFHQVHLICMPANKDNICKKSSQFHFVNDYLYQPIDDEGNLDNSSLLYADRYYPEGYEHGAPFDLSAVNEPEEIQYHAYNRRQEQQETYVAPQQQARPQRRRPATDPRNKATNDNRRSGQESGRPAGARPNYQSEAYEIDQEELSSHNLSPKERNGEVAPRRRRPVRPARPTYVEQAAEESDE